jgi:hypothetical protein
MTMPGAICPHCRRAIEPAPKRSRLCPHCRAPIVVRRGSLLTETQAATFDAEAGAVAAGKRKARGGDWFREHRGYTARDLKQAKASRGTVTGIGLLVSEDDCRVCQAARDRVFPVQTCTVEMLPPYRDCEYEEGCRATTRMVLSPEYAALGRTGKRAGGLAGCVMLALILGGIIIVVLACYGLIAGKG